MSDFTPVTTAVRYFYQQAEDGYSFDKLGAEFDRWLASVKADAWDERHKMDPCVTGIARNPYREGPK